MENQFTSQFGIDKQVEFYPTFKEAKKMGIDVTDILEGEVKSVLFTEAKVFYGVYNPYYGKIFKNIPSEKVFAISEVSISSSIK